MNYQSQNFNCPCQNCPCNFRSTLRPINYLNRYLNIENPYLYDHRKLNRHNICRIINNPNNLERLRDIFNCRQ